MEGIKTGALEQPVVSVVDWGIAPTALGFSSTAKSCEGRHEWHNAQSRTEPSMRPDVMKVLRSNGDNARSGASLCEDLSLLRSGATGSQGG